MVLNFLIYRTIKQKTFLNTPSAARAKREFYIATILILIVSLFGICQILRCVLNILELVSVLHGKHAHIHKLDYITLLGQEDLEKSLGGMENMFVSLSHLLITINCSANFAIYCYKVCKLVVDLLNIIYI